MFRDDGDAQRLRIEALERELADARREIGRLERGGRPRSARAWAAAIAGSLVLAVVIAAAASARSRPPSRPRPSRAASSVVERAPDPETTTFLPAPPPIGPAPGSLSGESDRDDARAEAIAAAIEPTAPRAIEILARRSNGAEEYVLYRWLGGERWRAREEARGTYEDVRAGYEERLELCQNGAGSIAEEARCAIDEAPDRWRGWSEGVCDRAHAIELARIDAFDRVTGRVRIVDLACPSDGDDGAELRSADLDGDGALEITAIVPFSVPTTDDTAFEDARIAAIVDGRDLHAQLVVLRNFDGTYGDVDVYSHTIVTTWELEDRDADGHPDARIRQRIADDGEEGPSTSGRTTDCRYLASRDRWSCEAAWGGDPRQAGAMSAMSDLEILH
jgi:hypothetical protein